MRRSPADFRALLCLDGRPRRRLAEQLQPWQLRDFRALDPAWQALVASGGEPGAAIVRYGYLERPRGHSKTSDLAIQSMWVLLASSRPLNGIVAAADRDQAKLIRDAISRLSAANPDLCRDLRVLEECVRHATTGARLEIISSHAPSSYGALPDFIVCDELCHWSKPELWHSLFSAAAKRPHCVLTVLTNAGVGQGWQWEIRERARTSPQWYFSSLNGPQAPWITDDALLEQRALLPGPVFERLWLNIWQHSDGEFVTLAEVEGCRDASLTPRRRGEPGVQYVAAIDYAEKRDDTVGCLAHLEGDRVVIDRMDVIRPTPHEPTPVSWVRNWIDEVTEAFDDVRIVVDPHQLLELVQDLQHTRRILRFEFRAGKGNDKLARLLRQLIVEQRVAWYPGCGGIPPALSNGRRDDLETELASLVLRETRQGWIRFDHRQDGCHHDDRAFVLSVVCLTLIDAEDSTAFLTITPPAVDGGFVWS